MEPINKAERKKAFLNFMLLFLVCIIIVVTTVFFSTRVTNKENDQLIQYRDATEKKNNLNTEFTEKMIAISSSIDSIDIVNLANLPSLDHYITAELNKLNDMVSKDVNDNKLYIHVVTNLTALQTTKVSNRKNITASNDESKLNAQISQLQLDKVGLIKQLTDCYAGKH